MITHTTTNKGQIMAKFIVHLGTETIIDASECVILDMDDLDDHDEARITGDDYFDDGVVCELAERLGRPVNTSVPADVTYGNAIIFSPSAMREEARELIALGEPTEEALQALLYIAGIASDDELHMAGQFILGDDAMWDNYNQSFMDGVRYAHDLYKVRVVK